MIYYLQGPSGRLLDAYCYALAVFARKYERSGTYNLIFGVEL